MGHSTPETGKYIEISPSATKQPAPDAREKRDQKQAQQNAPHNQLLFDRQQRLVAHAPEFFGDLRLWHNSPLHQWRHHAMEKDPGHRQPDPDDEAEKAEDVDHRQLSNTLFPQFTKVGHDTDGKESHDKENAAEDIGLRHGGLGLR